MKKIISMLLAVALVFAAMSVSVLAATTTEHVVGTRPEAGDGTYNDGVELGNANGSSTPLDIYINFNKDISGDNIPDDGNSVIEHRYAVDIEYNNLIIDMASILENVTHNAAPIGTDYKYVWNVNTYQYELVKGNDVVTVNPSDPSSIVAKEIDAYRIKNHSDMTIWYTDAISAGDITLSTLSLTSNVGSTAQSVLKATPLNGAVAGSPTCSPSADTWNIITAKPATGKTWLDVVNEWATQTTAGTEKSIVGRITVTVAPTAP